MLGVDRCRFCPGNGGFSISAKQRHLGLKRPNGRNAKHPLHRIVKIEESRNDPVRLSIVAQHGGDARQIVERLALVEDTCCRFVDRHPKVLSSLFELVTLQTDRTEQRVRFCGRP